MNIPIKQYFNLLSKYLIAQKLRVFLLATILGFGIALQLVNPQIIRYFIDEATKSDSASKLTLAAIVFIGAALIQQLFVILSTYLSQNVGWKATNSLRLELLEHCLKLDMAFYKSHQPAEIIERIDGDVTALFNFFSKFLVNVVNNIILIVGILILLFREDYRIGICLSIFTLFAILTLWNIQKNAVDKWVTLRETSAKFFGAIGEVFVSTEDIKANGAKNHIMNRFYNQIAKWYPIQRKANIWYYFMWQSSLGVFAIGNMIAFGIGGYLWSKGIITIGAVYLIFNYTELLSNPIEQIRTQFEDLQKAGASIIRVQEILDIKASLQQDNGEKLSEGSIFVELKNVGFEYDEGCSVLSDISFKLSKGNILGILGRTGSGKTTMARMLARLYDPSEGQIYFNGKKLNSIEHKELRKHVAYVTQDVQLFNASVRDNITFFNQDIKDEEIINSIFEIGLGEWYKLLPVGLDTILEAGGGGLSSGEGQLLAFVRVFLRNPGLIILDEASSRLDPITEKLVETALDKLLKNRTCIIIAHKLGTLKRADDVLILEEGKIIEHGDRKKLMEDHKSRLYNLLKVGTEGTSEMASA